MLITNIRIEPAQSLNHWPFTIPSIQSLAGNGLELTRSIVVLVGDNGSGKSTLLDAIAQSYGLDVRGGHGSRKYASSTKRLDLANQLHLRLVDTFHTPKHRRRGFYLRADTAFGLLSFMAEQSVPGYGKSPAVVSHGESYIETLPGRFNGTGLFLLDEGDSPLEIRSVMKLMRHLIELSRQPSTQIILATHNPLVAAVPGAQILELSGQGIVERRWESLPLVKAWRSALADPSLLYDN